MGRRSINTTKSGKYMNPTDQARKEARKKELKKNKRQRQIVRTAVLRGKDPMQLLAEMEKIDQMEYNVLQPSPLNEKVLKDKRKKLRDTFDRVMKMYYKDDLEKWREIRQAETEYERRRSTLLAHYEAVRHTQQVSVDEIPLPLAKNDPFSGLPVNVPLPNEYGMLPLSSYNTIIPPPTGILRKKSAYSPPPSPSKVSKRNKIPPGVPPGPPPELSGEEDEGYFGDDRVSDKSSDSEGEGDNDRKKSKKKAIRFAAGDSSDSEGDESKRKLKTVPNSGQDIDTFMKEMEEVHRKREAERAGRIDDEIDRDDAPPGTVTRSIGPLPPGLPPAPPLGVPPPLMFRPPPMMMGPGGIRLPPGPPPGRPPALPPGPPPGLPRLGASGIRLPPGPPPGMPPSMIRFSAAPANSIQATPNVLSAAPQLIHREDGEESTVKSAATIEAKAQMRNLNADITRFLPTSVRIKRDEGKRKLKPEKKDISFDLPKPVSNRPVINPSPATTQPSKDDAYMQFMREMEGLL